MTSTYNLILQAVERVNRVYEDQCSPVRLLYTDNCLKLVYQFSGELASTLMEDEPAEDTLQLLRAMNVALNCLPSLSTTGLTCQWRDDFTTSTPRRIFVLYTRRPYSKVVIEWARGWSNIDTIRHEQGGQIDVVGLPYTMSTSEIEDYLGRNGYEFIERNQS